MRSLDPNIQKGYIWVQEIRYAPSKYRTCFERDGPLENLSGGGGGEVQTKHSRKGKVNEKKFMHAN